MQRQEINLFSSFESRQPAARFLTWNRLWLGYLIVCVFFTIIYVLSYTHLYFLKKNQAALQTILNARESEFLKVKSTFPPLFFSSNVDGNVEEMQKELRAQKSLISSFEESLSFSNDLISFATNITPNVWLTSISLIEENGTVSLKGKSADMETLQQFINHLTLDKLFSGYVFNIDNITKVTDAKDNGNLLFELSMRKPTP